ncbi:hypothetical protein [Mycobacteroides abscessus]|uniref:hypothetical protein n=1 Tax=Mycobacteroides abscessus TaxID=36809 RepID=UPI002F9365FE
MAGRPIFDGPVSVTLQFVLPRPKSAPKSRTPAATKRPDLDKLNAPFSTPSPMCVSPTTRR